MAPRPDLNKWYCVTCEKRKTTDKFEPGQERGKKVCFLCAASDGKKIDPDMVIRQGLNLRRKAA